MPSPSAENSRRRIEGNSSAIRFRVVHLGSRSMEFEGGPVARCASSLASAETISLVAAAASAGQRKGVKKTKRHRRCDRRPQKVGLPGRIVNAADRRHYCSANLCHQRSWTERADITHRCRALTEHLYDRAFCEALGKARNWQDAGAWLSLAL